MNMGKSPQIMLAIRQFSMYLEILEGLGRTLYYSPRFFLRCSTPQVPRLQLGRFLAPNVGLGDARPQSHRFLWQLY